MYSILRSNYASISIQLLKRTNPYEQDSGEWHCLLDVVGLQGECTIKRLVEYWGVEEKHYLNYLPVLERDGIVKLIYQE